ncbi:LuxR C-terminal-related transcriptional regulator [Chloroflexota bacterium]
MTRKLILISAPAGSSKTTLLSEWIRQESMPAAWLSLDTNDNNIVRLLTYVIAALQAIEPNIGETALATLQLPQLPPLDTILTSVINEFTAFPDHFILVLDDYHVIDSKAVHDVLIFLLNHLPPQMHLVIATRTDPPLPLARLRMQELMLEIRADDLRFNLEEISKFFNEVGGFTLSVDEVAALEVRTEGWIAGLQLAALSMQGRDDVQSFIEAFTGSHRYILDYLTEEVLNRQTEAIQSFLLQTSILNRLLGSLCDAVTGQSDGQATLEMLEQANLFIVPLDDERCWYRYHHLFGDMLRRHLQKKDSNLIPVLHSRASAWYVEKDMRPEAIAHCLEAADFDQAADLIEQMYQNILGGTLNFTTILGWLEALPEEVVHAHPMVGILHVWMLTLTEQLDAVEPRLQEIERAAKGRFPDAVRFEIAVLRAYLARQNYDVDKAIELSLQALETFRENPTSGSILAYTGIAFNLALAYRTRGEMTQAQQWYAEALRVSQEADSITFILLALHGLACVHMVRGNLRLSEEHFRRGLQLADEATQQSGKVVPMATHLYLGLGELLYERNRLAEATDQVARGLELSRQWQMDAMTCRALIIQSRLKLTRQDWIGALNLIQNAEKFSTVYQETMPFCIPVSGARALVILTQAVSTNEALDPESLREVIQWAEVRNFSIGGSMNSLSSELEYLVWGRLLIAQKELDRALLLLTRMLQVAEDGERTGHVIEILILHALAYQARGDMEQGLVALERALTLAEPEKYVRLFLDSGTPMLELLRRAGAQGIRTSYAGQLLAAASITTDAIETEISPLVDPLSERELEILRLIALGCSNPEIAEELVLAIGTVKSHTGNIYSKLGVRNRTEAVVRARELNLL